MPRKTRVIFPGYPHHVVQRGHNKQPVFRDDDDRRYYLELLSRYMEQSRCTLMAYCLMPNHVHLMLRPVYRGSLIECLHGVGFRYAKYFNYTSGRSGALWEDRYHASVVYEEAYMWRVAQYICLNPVRAKIVDEPCKYHWSSAEALLRGIHNGVPVENWIDESQRRMFEEALLDQAEVQNIGVLFKRNIPYASAIGMRELEKSFGEKLLPNHRGRPKNGDGG